MQEQNTIECHPPRTPISHWFGIVGMSVMFPGMLILAFLVIVSELITNYQTPAQLKVVFAIISGVVGVGLMLWFLFWERDRWYWVLADDKLIGGRKKDKIFPLSSISAIVPGLPDETLPFLQLTKIERPDIWDSMMNERKLALLLKFADGSFMPFHVHKCVGGTRLMTSLVNRLSDRVVRDYQYTKQETKALRAADWNRVVKKKNA